MAVAQLNGAVCASLGLAVVLGKAGRRAGPRAGIRAEVSSGDIRPCSGESGAQVTGNCRPPGPQGKVGEPPYAAL